MTGTPQIVMRQGNLYSGQPVAFMKRPIELFTTPGDWIFDGIEVGMLHYSCMRICVHVALVGSRAACNIAFLYLAGVEMILKS